MWSNYVRMLFAQLPYILVLVLCVNYCRAHRQDHPARTRFALVGLGILAFREFVMPAFVSLLFHAFNSNVTSWSGELFYVAWFVLMSMGGAFLQGLALALFLAAIFSEPAEGAMAFMWRIVRDGVVSFWRAVTLT